MNPLRQTDTDSSTTAMTACHSFFTSVSTTMPEKVNRTQSSVEKCAPKRSASMPRTILSTASSTSIRLSIFAA